MSVCIPNVQESPCMPYRCHTAESWESLAIYELLYIVPGIYESLWPGCRGVSHVCERTTGRSRHLWCVHAAGDHEVGGQADGRVTPTGQSGRSLWDTLTSNYRYNRFQCRHKHCPISRGTTHTGRSCACSSGQSHFEWLVSATQKRLWRASWNQSYHSLSLSSLWWRSGYRFSQWLFSHYFSA